MREEYRGRWGSDHIRVRKWHGLDFPKWEVYKLPAINFSLSQRSVMIMLIMSKLSNVDPGTNSEVF